MVSTNPEGDRPRQVSERGTPDWVALSAALRAAAPGSATDDCIDALVELVLSGSPAPDAVKVMDLALERAESSLTRGDAALALAATAAPDDAGAVDALHAAYQRYSADQTVAPTLLDAIGLLAIRGSLARSELTSILLRLKPNDPWPLLLQAVKWIGRLDSIQPTPELRQKLTELSSAADFAVQSEIRQQLAFMELADALLASDSTQLRERLTDTRAAFARAEASEEHRPDAAVFVGLLDMLLAFLALPADAATVAERIRQISSSVRGLLRPGDRWWAGYQSEAEHLIGARVLTITAAIERAATAASEAQEWTNFDEALVELATLYAQVISNVLLETGNDRVGAALHRIASVVMVPQLGPVIMRSMNRLQLARVIERYVRGHGEDNIAVGLRSLEAAALASDYSQVSAATGKLLAQITDLAASTGQRPEDLLLEFGAAIEADGFSHWLEQHGLSPSPLSIERPDLYDADPAVDQAIRNILRALRTRLGEYPADQGRQLVRVLGSVVRFVRDVRDDLPPYTLCTADGGIGQDASEDHLQEDLFERLRREYGRAAVYERPRVAGGRPDTGLHFEECEYPIEVKHEFHSVRPDDIHRRYLAQADDYATARDRVSFLLILDLRAANCAGHQRQPKGSRQSGEIGSAVSLYRLDEGLWIDALPVDPQLPQARSNAIIIGLVPGNRSRPSSRTHYSKRPRRGGEE